ncbi:hypothetical protein G9274_000911 [Stenotrophomonas rhizophila]|nr:hypothetical protein G9274_000911 [Stenotrophomonas rhizophila]
MFLADPGGKLSQRTVRKTIDERLKAKMLAWFEPLSLNVCESCGVQFVK